MTVANKLAQMFINGDAVIPTDHEISLLNAWIDAQFAHIPIIIEFTDLDIDLPAMLEHFGHTGVMMISIAHNSHPFLSAETNAKFRAVHDLHHIVAGADSSLKGEIATFHTAASVAPREIRWMLFSEIVLQAAACISTGHFQPQKLVRIAGF